MRPFLLASVLVLAGCDTLGGDAGADLMSSLDGVWTRTVTTERIRPDGSVTAEGSARTDAFEVGRSIRCNRITLGNAGENDRIAVAYDPANPGGSRDCSVIHADGDGRRLIFVGDGATLVQDVVATVEEDGPDGHVWAFYAFDGGEAVRTLWTLTR